MTPEIRTLEPGEIITEPGFYNITLDVHHAQPCMTRERLALIQSGEATPEPHEVSVTSGVLRKMEAETPADVWAFHMLNPDRWEKPETDALRLGRAMAAFVEGGIEQVLSEYLTIPEDAPRRPTDAQRAKYEAGEATPAGDLSCTFWDKIDSDPRSILKPDDLEMITNMGTALAKDEAAVAVMGGIPEVTMAYQDEETGIWLLARPDTVAFDGTVSDFKKMSSQGRPFNHRLVDHRIEDHRYDMQLAFAAEIYERLTGDWPEMAAIIAQSDKPPFSVILREIEQEDLRFGQFHNRRSVRRFAECLSSGIWPGPGADIAAFQRAKWKREQILEEMNTAGEAP